MELRDEATLANPTRRRPRKGSQPRAQTVEERTWPEESAILSVMAHGFSYAEAWHMSPRDYRRFSALASAWSIPEDERMGTVRIGKAGQGVFG